MHKKLEGNESVSDYYYDNTKREVPKRITIQIKRAVF